MKFVHICSRINGNFEDLWEFTLPILQYWTLSKPSVDSELTIARGAGLWRKTCIIHSCSFNFFSIVWLWMQYVTWLLYVIIRLSTTIWFTIFWTCASCWYRRPGLPWLCDSLLLCHRRCMIHQLLQRAVLWLLQYALIVYIIDRGSRSTNIPLRTYPS